MKSGKRIVVVGAGGRLGAALSRAYEPAHDVVGFNHAQLDLAQAAALRQTLGGIDFDVLINCAAQTNVDRCESERDEAFAVNAEAPRVMAEVCATKGARLIHISTDYVFDGEKSQPYIEEDEARPISVYGESKREGERLVLSSDAEAVVARVSWVFGPDRPSFIDGVIKRARESETVDAVADKFSTPTYTLDIAEMLRPLLGDSIPPGLFHLANSGSCSWQEYAQWAINCCRAHGVPTKAAYVAPLSLGAMKNFVARRPPQTILSTEKFERVTGQRPRPWREAVEEYVRTHIAPGLAG